MIPPEIDERAVDQLLRTYLPLEPQRRLVLVHGRYAASARDRLTVTVGDVTHAVTVRDERSLLGIHGAWQDHRAARDGSVLVVTTGIADRSLGWDLRGHALRRTTLTVDPAEIVAQRFGAAEVEPRIRNEPWLLDALLDAEPTEGWRRTGPVLTRDVAVRALLGVRFGLTEDVPDPGALLQWSQAGPVTAQFTGLSAAEQDGIARWLVETVGPFAAVFTDLVRSGRAADAMPLGVVLSVLDAPAVRANTALAVGGLLRGAGTDPNERRVFVQAVEGTLERWITSAQSGGPPGETALARAVRVLDRADELARVAGLADEIADHRFLPSGFRGRLRAVAAQLSTALDIIDTGAVDAARAALARLREHQLARLHPQQCATAAMAVRLVRWLATPEAGAGTVPLAIREHARCGGWVDRATTMVWAGDAVADPVVAAAYAAVHDAARRRRRAADQGFAVALRTWSEHAATAAPAGVLLVEQVLEEIAVPLSTVGAPLVVVVDGMSAAVAAELGEQILDRSFIEVSRDPAGRDAAVATVPSVTRASRASLLTGRAGAGDQSYERNGFESFWKRHRRDAVLLHMTDVAGTAGRRLADPLVEALADGGVVGVVLNTVDDALDHGREGDRTAWRLSDITFLPELLDAARSYGRPVVLVSDHGHVLDRTTDGAGPSAATGIESARWRTGEPRDGEVALEGPRVLEGGGRIVAAWREDIRYTRRRCGYHGGASLAEMTVPVLTFLPDAVELPLGWSVLAPEVTEPPWWNGRTAPIPSARPARPARRPTKPARPVADGQGMLELPAAATAAPVPAPAVETLGRRVVVSPVFAAQRKFVRRAPELAAVARLLDTLVEAGGELSATAAVAALGRPGRDPGAVLAQLQRLLNVESYPVLNYDGRTVRLDIDMLLLQFEVKRQ